MNALAIALGAWALVIIYMACALSYRQIKRACARRVAVARLARFLETDPAKIEQARASIETPVSHIGFTLGDVLVSRQINIDARAECADGCGCGNWRAHADHIRQDADTMRLYGDQEFYNRCSCDDDEPSPACLEWKMRREGS